MLCGAFILGACQKIEQREDHYDDESLTGVVVTMPNYSSNAKKLFVLNEGNMGSNNASLDFLRLQYGLYISDAFKQMNPSIGAGLGDVGNDIVVIGNEAWIVVNNSGIVEVISALDEKEIKAISIPTPRFIAFDDKYAYVTSWAGAYIDYATYEGSNPKGQVYRIDLKTKEVKGSVEVGYQPEGIAYSNGKLYVANSGGLSSMLPPSYSYDNTVSIIDAASFTVTQTVNVQVNLKNVYSDGNGNIYVTSLGNYYDVHSGIYMFKDSSPESSVKISDYVSVSNIYERSVFCVGTESEFDWEATSHNYNAFVIENGKKTDFYLDLAYGTPYSIGILDYNTLFVGDAGDYFNPGTVTCYWHGNKVWTVEAGVSPGHFAFY